MDKVNSLFVSELEKHSIKGTVNHGNMDCALYEIELLGLDKNVTIAERYKAIKPKYFIHCGIGHPAYEVGMVTVYLYKSDKEVIGRASFRTVKNLVKVFAVI